MSEAAPPSAAPATFAVLNARFRAEGLVELAARLAPQGGRARLDTASRLRRLPGVLAERVSREEAEHLVAQAALVGVAARVVAAPALVPPLHVRRLIGATFGEEEIRLRPAGGDELPASFLGDEVTFASAAIFATPAGAEPTPPPRAPNSAIDLIAATYEAATSGHPFTAARTRVREYQAAQENPSGHRLVLWLDLGLAIGTVFRLRSDAFDFRGLGPALGASTFTNARRAAERLERALPARVRRTLSWRALQREELPLAAFPDAELYDSWLRWRMSWFELDDEPHEEVPPLDWTHGS